MYLRRLCLLLHSLRFWPLLPKSPLHSAYTLCRSATLLPSHSRPRLCCLSPPRRILVTPMPQYPSMKVEESYATIDFNFYPEIADESSHYA
ncbi:hypothetical protein BDZ97DRAFT_740481 [Flammula alnicola]|nr:hypothetical protein BDZ97DRAFT_740481 [Flammula alnicola]